MKNKSLYFYFFLLFVWGCTDREKILNALETETDTHSIHFKYDKFSYAWDEAQKLNKPLLLYFTSDGCSWCVKMEREIFSDSTIFKYMNENFICSKVYLKKPFAVMKSKDHKKLNKTQLEFMNLYNIKEAFPTFVIMDIHGKLTKKESGFMNVQEFIHFAKDGL